MTSVPSSPREGAAPGLVQRLRFLLAALIRCFAHPAALLLGLSTCVAFLVRALFFKLAIWLWHFALPVNLRDITPWARWAMVDRDGAEPYGLVAAVLVEWLITGVSFWLLLRLPKPWRALFSIGLLTVAALLALALPPLPPLADIQRAHSWASKFTLGCLAATWLVMRIMRRQSGVPTPLAVLLVPLCLVPIAFTNLPDLTCILLPALRIQQGVPLSQIYFQYDLLPSLLALAWIKLGGAPAAFSALVGITYYALFLGIFAFASRLFQRAQLAAPLLISAMLVRFYGFYGYAAPQTTPMRLDLWLLPLVVVYRFGLRHWSVGLILGGLTFFSRSVSPLFVLPYALTSVVEFLVTRYALPRADRAPLARALTELLRQSAPVAGCLALALLASRLVFGSFSSDALTLYRTYQAGMMRIAPDSFYWWLLALTGGAGVLFAWQRPKLGTRRGQTAIFGAALTLGSSLYFFGRSHENNLINTAVPFLFCLFLALDVAWPAREERVLGLRLAFLVAPWLVVASCAYFYSGRAGRRIVLGQFAEVMTMTPLLQQNSPQPPPLVDCNEIAQAAPERRVLFFTKDDYWYYQACNYAAPGYIQPAHLILLKQPLIQDMTEWLHAGYKIFVPRADDWMGGGFPEFRAHLPVLDSTLTSHFYVYSLHH